MGRILVTGGAGFIGSHVVEALLGDGHEVLVIDNLRSGLRSNLEPAWATAGFTYDESDILDEHHFDSLVAGFSPDALVHLAALVSVQEARSNPALNFRLNIEATHRMAEAARRFGVRRIVFASSAAVYGETASLPVHEQMFPRPLSLYGAAKNASEQLLAAAGMDFGFEVVALRFFNVFGPRQRPDSPYSGVISIFASRLCAGQPLTIYGDGRQTRDFVSVFDVARATATAATHPGPLGGTFNVCTGQETSLLGLVGDMELVSGRKAEVVHVPAREGDIRHSRGNPSAFATATGFRPSTPVKTALQSFMHWLKSCDG